MSYFNLLDYFILRSPTLPTCTLNYLSAACNAHDFKERVREICKNEEFSNALLLASPVFYERMKNWLSEEKLSDKKIEKTIYKYVSRISNRSTPFGNFAGISRGDIKDSEASRQTFVRSHNKECLLQLDFEIIAAIVKRIQNDAIIRSRLRIYPNDTIYKSKNVFKFYRKRVFNKKDYYFLSHVSATDILEETICLVQQGIEQHVLVKKLAKNNSELHEINNYIDRLLQQQILFSELQPMVLGIDPLHGITAIVKNVDTENRILPTLFKIQSALSSKNSLHEIISEIRGSLRELNIAADDHVVIRGDQRFYLIHNALPKKSLNGIAQCLQQLLPLSVERRNKNLEEFKQHFKLRYPGKMIPLLEALDEDSGIGYDSDHAKYRKSDPIIQDLTIANSKQDFQTNRSRIKQFIFFKYDQATRNGWKNIELAEEELSTLKEVSSHENRLPPTFSAFGSLLRKSHKHGDFTLFLRGIAANSPVNLMSRFAHLDNKLKSNLQETVILENSSYSAAIVAEINHLPNPAVGNILERPLLKDYQIPLFSSSLQQTKSIALTDLHVVLRGDKLILWSLELQKEVIPRMSSAHNYTQGLNIYKFLCDLQYPENDIGIKWDWGELSTASFLPRVTYKSIILARAQWQLQKNKDITQLNKIYNDKLDEIITKNSLPQRVVLIKGDHELLLDLHCDIGREILSDELCRADVTLCEDIFDDFKSAVKCELGESYNNELILPFKNSQYVDKTSIWKPAQEKSIAYSLGSEWIYVNIFCGKHYADTVLSNAITRIVEELTTARLLTKWFFVRYEDSGHHLRFRVEIKNSHDIGAVVASIHKSLNADLQEGLISKIQFDTYFPEVERYGSDAMAGSEDFFWHDSEYVLNIIKQNPNTSDRWESAIVAIDDLLKASGFTIDRKLEFCKHMRDLFCHEFGNLKKNNQVLNDQFRKKKFALEELLGNSDPTVCQSRSKRYICVQGLFAKLTAKSRIDAKNTHTFPIIASFIHMFINRIFISDQRLHEFGTYHLLTNHYRREIGKKKNNSETNCL